jgi:hypothetical protein
MSYHWLVVIALTKTVAAFILFFVYLPTKIFLQPRGTPRIEQFFENLILMASSAVILVHILVLARIYSIVTLIFCYVMLSGAMFWYREKALVITRLMAFRIEKVVLVLDILDHVVDPEVRAWESLKNKWKRLKEWTKDRHALIHAVLFAAILFYSAVLRYADVFRSSAFGYSDPYTHLLWMKDLESGVLFPPGPPQHNPYYPKGFHAFLAILHGLTGLDGTSAVRLAGPLVGVLLVLSVYYAGRKLTQSRDAALVGMFVFGTFIQAIPLLDKHFVQDGKIQEFIGPGFLAGWFSRQTTPLPEQFALVFLMPALLRAYDYIAATARKSDLLLFFLSLLLVFMVHSGVAVALCGGFALLITLSLLFRPTAWRRVSNLCLAALLSSIVGNATLIYGTFAGSQMEQAWSGYGDWLTLWERLGPIPYSLEILLSASVAAILFLFGLVFARGRQAKLLWAFTGLYLGALTFGARSLNFGIKYLLPLDRIGYFRILVLSVSVAGLFHILTLGSFLDWYRRRSAYQALTLAAIFALFCLGMPSGIPTAPRYEYDTFARILQKIRMSFPPLEWTIVSTVEDYSQIVREGGWHLDPQEFLMQYDPYQTRVDIPTPYTFLFVEKKPFAVSSDPQATAHLRHDLERRLAEWAILYNIKHSDMLIYYQDWDVAVYLIARNDGSLAKPLPARGGPTIVTEVLRDLWRR